MSDTGSWAFEMAHSIQHLKMLRDRAKAELDRLEDEIARREPPALQGLENFKLYAWMGEDEFGSGEIGLKQGRVPAGLIPMVSLDKTKLDKYWSQAEAQARHYHKTICLVRFKFADVVRCTNCFWF
jgi:hypothetical protein